GGGEARRGLGQRRSRTSDGLRNRSVPNGDRQSPPADSRARPERGPSGPLGRQTARVRRFRQAPFSPFQANDATSGQARLFGLVPDGRARCVPDRTVNQGEQRALTDKLTRPPTWEQPGSGGG